jgi:hypothetical protein
MDSLGQVRRWILIKVEEVSHDPNGWCKRYLDEPHDFAIVIQSVSG